MNHIELLAVSYGLKSVSRQKSSLSNLPKLKKECNKRDLVFVTTKRDSGTFFYISKDKEKARNALLIEEELIKPKNIVYDVRSGILEFLDVQRVLNAKLGQLYGYPKCCIDSYNKLNYGAMYKFNTHKTKKFEAPNFVSNMFKEKISNVPFQLNMLLRDFKIISHFPCSAECKASLKIGKGVLNVISKEDPSLYSKIICVLKHPALVWNENKYIFFDGKITKEHLHYDKILMYKNVPNIGWFENRDNIDGIENKNIFLINFY